MINGATLLSIELAPYLKKKCWQQLCYLLLR